MNISTTQIKIYGLGISLGIQKLDELEKNKDLRAKIRYSGIHLQKARQESLMLL